MAVEYKNPRRRWIIIVSCLSLLALIFFTLPITSTSALKDVVPLPLGSSNNEPLPTSLPHAPSLAGFVKPEGVKIVGLVFYGRKSRVEIMRCYLERNMVDRGGWLDEVHWVENTGKKDDLAYLEKILKSNERYKKIDLKKEGIGFEGYAHAWGHLKPGHLYVKIDDDVIWFADDTIPRIVTLKVNNPNYLLVSANIINSPLMGWVHYHMGAQHPYLPELLDSSSSTPPLLPSKPPSWRPSKYPYWTGPDDYFFPLSSDPPSNSDSGASDISSRWLRLRNSSAIHRTPIAETEYATWGAALQHWPIAAQSHYSFLENLEADTLRLYKTDRVWLTDYKRLSINMMVVAADDVLENLPMDTVDEEWLTVRLPERLGRSVAVEMNAMASHLSFGGQVEGVVAGTDLLGRYKSYADELVCGR